MEWNWEKFSYVWILLFNFATIARTDAFCLFADQAISPKVCGDQFCEFSWGGDVMWLVWRRSYYRLLCDWKVCHLDFAHKWTALIQRNPDLTCLDRFCLPVLFFHPDAQKMWMSGTGLTWVNIYIFMFNWVPICIIFIYQGRCFGWFDFHSILTEDIWINDLNRLPFSAFDKLLYF